MSWETNIQRTRNKVDPLDEIEKKPKRKGEIQTINWMEGSMELHGDLLEDMFFLAYYLNIQPSETNALPVYVRKWFIEWCAEKIRSQEIARRKNPLGNEVRIEECLRKKR